MQALEASLGQELLVGLGGGIIDSGPSPKTIQNANTVAALYNKSPEKYGNIICLVGGHPDTLPDYTGLSEAEHMEKVVREKTKGSVVKEIFRDDDSTDTFSNVAWIIGQISTGLHTADTKINVELVSSKWHARRAALIGNLACGGSVTTFSAGESEFQETTAETLKELVLMGITRAVFIKIKEDDPAKRIDRAHSRYIKIVKGAKTSILSLPIIGNALKQPYGGQNVA